MKKFFAIFAIAAAMFASCNEPVDPHRAPLEQYAKSHIANPDSYKFEGMRIPKEYNYIFALGRYREELLRQAAATPDNAAILAEDDRLQPLIEKYPSEKQVACYEYALDFSYDGGRGTVYARYYDNGDLMIMTMDPSQLDPEPVFQILRERGEF